jgi:signal transduction histidine kinase
VVRLSNGDLVGVECGLSLAEHDFMMCLLLGHDRVCHGVWLFARDQCASLHAVEDQVRWQPCLRCRIRCAVPDAFDASLQGEDRAVCEELARRAGMAVDNARLYHVANSANQAKDHFLAALSHELRTPLTPVLLLTDSLLGTAVSLVSMYRIISQSHFIPFGVA